MQTKIPAQFFSATFILLVLATHEIALGDEYAGAGVYINGYDCEEVRKARYQYGIPPPELTMTVVTCDYIYKDLFRHGSELGYFNNDYAYSCSVVFGGGGNNRNLRLRGLWGAAVNDCNQRLSNALHNGWNIINARVANIEDLRITVAEKTERANKALKGLGLFLILVLLAVVVYKLTRNTNIDGRRVEANIETRNTNNSESSLSSATIHATRESLRTRKDETSQNRKYHTRFKGSTYSEEDKGLWGDGRTRHRDGSGSSVGYSHEEEGIFGDERTQHLDNYGVSVGYSQKETGLFEDDRTQHYDDRGEKTGYSKVEEGFWGDERTQHYDDRGEKTGYSKVEKGFWGDERVQEYNQDGTKSTGNDNNSGGCFITSACIASKKLPDNCAQLMLLRDFRDSYVSNTIAGKNLIDEYYNIAPSIVAAIERNKSKNEIYNYIYHEVVMVCIALIREGRKEAALLHYIDNVRLLENMLLMHSS